LVLPGNLKLFSFYYIGGFSQLSSFCAKLTLYVCKLGVSLMSKLLDKEFGLHIFKRMGKCKSQNILLFYYALSIQ